jgi:hypothetical protein
MRPRRLVICCRIHIIFDLLFHEGRLEIIKVTLRCWNKAPIEVVGARRALFHDCFKVFMDDGFLLGVVCNPPIVGLKTMNVVFSIF